MLCGLLACHAQTNGYESLSVEAYEQTIADTSVVRLDVRTAAEFAEGHIYKAVNIDVLKPDFEQKAVASLPKNRLIAVNCRSGKRSKNAANILVHNGYKVVELDNGYQGWVAAGKKVVKYACGSFFNTENFLSHQFVETIKIMEGKAMNL